MSESPAPPAQPDILDFTPVPLARARHDGWTPARQQRFIDQLARIGLVSAAAKACGMSATSAYNLRARPGAESFATAWDEALALGQATADATAIDRAIDGEVRPVFYKGRQIGHRTLYNDRLLIAALRRFSASKAQACAMNGPATLPIYEPQALDWED
jgi:hypothetical protein